MFFTLLDDKNISCKNGKVLSNIDFCRDCQECPINKQSSVALTSNCSKTSNNFCPVTYDTSKICINRLNVSLPKYCTKYEDAPHWICPKANKGLDFEQCYD